MKKCKVYSDGSHYIAIRPTEGSSGPRRRPPPEEPIEVEEEILPSDEPLTSCLEAIDAAPEFQQEQAEGSERAAAELAVEPDQAISMVAKRRRISTKADEFLKWYRESYGMRPEDQYDFIASKLAPYFRSERELYRYLDYKMDCKKRAEITRRIRCLRRAALHGMSYFATFTYDSKKVTEKQFEKRLLTALSNLASRKGWKYMGTWERGGDTARLHFHAILYIPEDKMTGKMEQKREYDVKKKRMVEYTENTFFQDRFGRNSFEVIDGTALTIGTAVSYIIKYIEKSGGRIICSRGMKTFIETDVDNKDVVTRLREDDDKKYILFDDFKVYLDGQELGTVTPGVLARAKMVN